MIEAEIDVQNKFYFVEIFILKYFGHLNTINEIQNDNSKQVNNGTERKTLKANKNWVGKTNWKSLLWQNKQTEIPEQIYQTNFKNQYKRTQMSYYTYIEPFNSELYI